MRNRSATAFLQLVPIIRSFGSIRSSLSIGESVLRQLARTRNGAPGDLFRRLGRVPAARREQSACAPARIGSERTPWRPIGSTGSRESPGGGAGSVCADHIWQVRALLCPAALLAAAAAETSGYAATPFAGRLPLLFPGVLVVQVLLQCFPGLLLLLHLTQNPPRQQRTSRRAVCRTHESAERGARCNEKMKAPPASASQSARSAVQRHLGPDEANSLDKTERIRAFGPRT